jgi:hypothetical protein
VVDLLVADLRRRLADRRLELRLSEAARRHIAAEGFDPVYGARPLRRYLQRQLETRIGRALLRGDVTDGSTLTVDHSGDGGSPSPGTRRSRMRRSPDKGHHLQPPGGQARRHAVSPSRGGNGMAPPQRRAMTGDVIQSKWFYCLRHRRVEPLHGCRAVDRLGPYPDRQTASRALDIARERTEAADRYDREWWDDEDED